MAQTSNKAAQPTKRSTPLWLIALLFLVATSLSFVAMAALFGNHQQGEAAPSRPVAATIHTPLSAWPTSTPNPIANNFPRISAATLKQLLDEHVPLQVLDNSSDDEYNAAHLPAAMHFQLQDLTLRQGELDAGRPVILYCNCTAEQVSITFGRALQVRGFSDVRVLSGGLKAWQQAGYPTAKGNK